MKLPLRTLGCHKQWKRLSFCEIWNNHTLTLLLIRPLTNKYCRAWSSMINLWIDSRTCQKYGILLSARQRSNDYLELPKENVLENMLLSHWPCFTWKFFTKWFHKILKLIFLKQPLCPRSICTQHLRKPPILTAFLEIFLYLIPCWTRVKSFFNCAIHLFSRQNKVFSLHVVDQVVSNFYFDLVPLFYFLKWNCYFLNCENLPNSHVIFERTSQFPLYFLSSNFSAQKERIPRFWDFWVLESFFIDMTRTSLLLILSSIFTLDKNMPSKVSILRLSSALIKICQIPHVIP